MKIPKDKLKYIDIPDLSETFVDSLGMFTYENRLARLDFRVTRLDAPKPPKPPTGKQYPACRMVMTTEVIVDLCNQLNQIMGVLVQEGIIKQEEIPKPTVQ